MEADTLVKLISESSEALEKRQRGDVSQSVAVNDDGFFFSCDEKWSSEVFQPEYLKETRRGIEQGMKKSLVRDLECMLFEEYD
jgi:hypothetical protein